MLRFLFLLALPCLLAAENRWIKFTSGPFQVFTDAGTHAGRETMVRLEEFRHAVGEVVGAEDVETPQPVRILLFRDAHGWTTPEPIAGGRDCHGIVLEEKAAISPAVYSALARLFLDASTNRMPPGFERGLIQFFSTFESQGVRITVGAPPGEGPPGPDLDWALVHLLVVDPQYAGRIKVLLYNLRNGVDEDACFRNAFGKSAAEVKAQAQQHLAMGNFQTGTISGRPLADRDFPERPVSDADARLARADLLAGTSSASEYQALLRDDVKVPEAQEGLGLLALGDHHDDDARRHFAAAMGAGSTSARCYIEYARLEPDPEKATQALLKAAGINPKLDEPFALLAARDTDPRKRLEHWKAAAERNPRNPAYWKELAECYLADHNYAEAAKAWTHGEQAATDPAERQRMRQARLAIEQQRLDYEEAAKRRQAEDDARETEKLKQQALAHVHEIEARYSDGTPKSSGAPVPWWDGPRPSGKVRGTLRQVECLGSKARLTVQSDDHKTVRLLVADPSKVSIAGRGEQTFSCGKQAPRPVSIEYIPKVDARLGTVGEVATIEFQ
jgi:tetratricopeptide (TPR) repeat protein